MAGKISCFILSLFSIAIFSIIYKFINKKKDYCYIKFNSYFLLLIMIVTFALMNIILFYSDEEHINKANYPKILIFIFNILSSSLFISFFLRISKIIQSINLTNALISNNRKKASIFYSKRYSLMENFYFKLFCFLLIITFIISFIKFFNNIEHYNFIPFLSSIPGKVTPEKVSLLKFNVWLVFFKSLIIITILYQLLTFTNIKKNMRIILSLQNLIYLLYFQLIFFANILTSNKTSLPHIIFYLFEISEIFLVIIYTLIVNKNDNMLITTIINPKLVSDFYLFVSDEMLLFI